MCRSFVENWPTPLNPCLKSGGHYRSSYWDVQGCVTKLCSDCVFDMEKCGMERREVLNTFKPDPNGAKVIEYDKDNILYQAS